MPPAPRGEIVAALRNHAPAHLGPEIDFGASETLSFEKTKASLRFHRINQPLRRARGHAPGQAITLSSSQLPIGGWAKYSCLSPSTPLLQEQGTTVRYKYSALYTANALDEFSTMNNACTASRKQLCVWRNCHPSRVALPAVTTS